MLTCLMLWTTHLKMNVMVIVYTISGDSGLNVESLQLDDNLAGNTLEYTGDDLREIQEDTRFGSLNAVFLIRNQFVLLVHLCILQALLTDGGPRYQACAC